MLPVISLTKNTYWVCDNRIIVDKQGTQMWKSPPKKGEVPHMEAVNRQAEIS